MPRYTEFLSRKHKADQSFPSGVELYAVRRADLSTTMTDTGTTIAIWIYTWAHAGFCYRFAHVTQFLPELSYAQRTSEKSIFLRYQTVSNGKYLPTFRRNPILLHWSSTSPCNILRLMTLNMEAVPSFGKAATSYQSIQLTSQKAKLHLRDLIRKE